MADKRYKIWALCLGGSQPSPSDAANKTPFSEGVKPPQSESPMEHRNLEEMLEGARRFKVSDLDRKKQTRSFAYGNVHLSNPDITREDIDRAAEEFEEK